MQVFSVKPKVYFVLFLTFLRDLVWEHPRCDRLRNPQGSKKEAVYLRHLPEFLCLIPSEHSTSPSCWEKEKEFKYRNCSCRRFSQLCAGVWPMLPRCPPKHCLLCSEGGRPKVHKHPNTNKTFSVASRPRAQSGMKKEKNHKQSNQTNITPSLGQSSPPSPLAAIPLVGKDGKGPLAAPIMNW